MDVQTVNRPKAGPANRQSKPFPIAEGAVVVVAVASAIAGGLVGDHPTGTSFVDPLYCAFLAGAVPLALSVSGRLSWLWLATVSAAMSRGPLLVPAGASLLTAVAGCLPRRSRAEVGALCGAVSVQVVLRWPAVGFHGATALVAAAAVLPALINALLSISSSLRRWILYGIGAFVSLLAIFLVPAITSILASRAGLSQGIAATNSALDALRHGEASSGTKQLSTAATDFRKASRSVGAWWTLGTDFVPIAAQQRRAVVGAAGVAAQVVTVAGDQARSIDFSSLRYHGGIDLAKLSSFAQPLAAVTGVLQSANGRLDAIRSPWLLSPLQSRLARLDAEVNKAQNSASLATQAVADAPSLLGGSGPRRYFIGLLDTSESRGLGGLLVWYGILNADNGHLSLGQFGDAVNLGTSLAASGRGHLTGPADYLARYGRFQPQKTFIDAPYAPDLPTVTDVVSQLYGDLANPPIDGMIILDPRSLASILDLLGPVDVPGIGVLNSSNAEQFFESGQYALYPDPGQQAARKKALRQVMQDVSDRLVAGALPGPQALSSVLGVDVRRGDLAIWSLHPRDQALLRRTGLADSFPSAKGRDLVSVVTQNAANNKIDSYLQRTIHIGVTYDRASGLVQDTVNIDLANQAPSSGLSYQVIDSYPGITPPPGPPLPVGTNLTWLTVYSPLKLVSATLGGRSFPMAATPELGVTAYSGYVEIPSRSDVRVTLELRGSIGRNRPYQLALYQQPMIHPDRVDVVVDEGNPAAIYSWVPTDKVTDFRVFGN